MKRKRLSFILLLLVGLAGVLVLDLSRSERRTFALGDGSKLTVCGISAGTNCTYRYGNTFQQIATRIPGQLGQKLSGGIWTHTAKASETNLVFWFRHQGSSNNLSKLRFQMIDDQGASAYWFRHTVTQPGWMNAKPIRQNDTALYYRHSVWPRRSRNITVRVFDKSAPGEDRLLGEVTLFNPGHADYPEWSPEQLPASRRDGDAVFTLDSFMVEPPQGISDQGNIQSLLAKASFSVKSDSQPKSEWTLWPARISDATGNRDLVWSGYQRNTVDRRLRIDNEWLLWPGEKTCKIETLWVPRSGYTPEEILELCEVPVGRGFYRSPLLATNLANSDISIMLIGGPTPARGESEYRLWSMGKNLNMWSARDCVRPLLVGVRDNQGRDLRVTDHGQFRVENDVKTVDLRVAVSKGRWAEFIAGVGFNTLDTARKSPSQ